MPAPWTVGAVLEAAHKYLGEKKLPDPRLEAELLLAHSLELSRFDLYMQYHRPLNEDERAVFRNILKERATGRPLQHLTGSQAFRRLNLAMAPGVFIPRPETELLVETVLSWLPAFHAPAHVLELGCGSGAICVSLAVESPASKIDACDISPEALELSAANARAHNAQDRIKFFLSDLFSAVPAGRRYHAIVANPPYIPSADIESLATEVRDHEPRAALDGGDSGLDFYRRIAESAPDYLAPGGRLAFEVGIGQAEAVAALLENAGFARPEIHKDYARVDRIVTGRLAEDARPGDSLKAVPAVVPDAVSILKSGGVAVVPTDTVYGLACRFEDDAALDRIFDIKGRPEHKGLIAMIADAGDAELLCEKIPPGAAALMDAFWPGPLTLVLEARQNLHTKALVSGKIGVRLPDHDLLRALIRAVGGPLAVTSANLSGSPSPTGIERCREELGAKVDLLIDDGPSPLGVESTVVDATGRAPKVLRAGAVPESAIIEKWREIES